MAIGEQIKKKREELGMTQEELAQKLGYKSKSTINKIESGINDIPQKRIVQFAEALHTTTAELMEWSGEATKPEMHLAIRLPVLGRVAAGIPLDAIEEIIDWEEVPEELTRDGEYFCLQIHGDSMEPRICDGDVVVVRKQSDADDGDLVIALINGDDAVCKRLKKYATGIALVSNNPAYQPMYYSYQDAEEIPVKVIGKVRELRGKF